MVSLVGVLFNWLVLVGVRGNSRLGTTVNILLVWISTSAIMQSTVGATAKILIFGKGLSFNNVSFLGDRWG